MSLRRFWTLSSGVLATEPYCSTESLICLVKTASDGYVPSEIVWA